MRFAVVSSILELSGQKNAPYSPGGVATLIFAILPWKVCKPICHVPSIKPRRTKTLPSSFQVTRERDVSYRNKIRSMLIEGDDGERLAHSFVDLDAAASKVVDDYTKSVVGDTKFFILFTTSLSLSLCYS